VQKSAQEWVVGADLKRLFQFFSPFKRRKTAPRAVTFVERGSTARPATPRKLMSLRTSALVSVLALGCSLACSSNSGSSPKSDDADAGTYLGLAPPTDGFQVRDIGTTIAAGDDQEFCEVAELPGTASTTYYVSGWEMGNSAQSHHLIISASTPGSKSDAKLRAMNIGDKVPCLGAQIEFGEDMVSIGGIQHPYGKDNLPDGIASTYVGGSRIVFDYHFYNTTEHTVPARSAINFHLTEKSKVKQLAGGIGFPNWTIDTPPGQQGKFVADCRLKHDATVGGLTRHTHRWGTDFSAWFSGGADDGKLVWTTPNFNTDVDYTFDQPVDVKAGDGFKYECDYDNTENYALRFGVKASDEMCILFGDLWDAHGAYDAPVEDCQVTWVDPAGVGHPADYPGAFPPASAAGAGACLAGAGADPTACTTCTCNSCGDILVKCFTDADCGPIVQCSEKGGDCQSVISDHSPGTGLAQQVGACVQAKCGSLCGGSGSGDAGVVDSGK
jgi:hypothetical protein